MMRLCRDSAVRELIIISSVGPGIMFYCQFSRRSASRRDVKADWETTSRVDTTTPAFLFSRGSIRHASHTLQWISSGWSWIIPMILDFPFPSVLDSRALSEWFKSFPTCLDDSAVNYFYTLFRYISSYTSERSVAEQWRLDVAF